MRGWGVRGGARALCLCLRRAGPAEQLGPLRRGGRRLPRTAGASGSLCGGPGRGGPLSPPSLPSLPAAVPGRSAAPAGCHGEGRSRVAAAAAGLTRGGAGRAGGRVAAAATFRTPAAAAAAAARGSAERRERQCPDRPKPCPQMARTTTTSSRITGPSSPSGSTRCGGSAPTGTAGGLRRRGGRLHKAGGLQPPPLPPAPHCPAAERSGDRRDACGGSPCPGGRKAV